VNTRIASLLRRAQETRRQIWASLPFGYRLAHVFRALSQSYIQEWGRTIGSLLLAAGVEDMPDPGPRWDPVKANPRNLPPKYLYAEADRLYTLALKTVGNPSDAQDVMQDVLVKLYADNKIKSVPFSTALSYLTTMIIWAAKNRRKKNQRGPTVYRGIGEDTADTEDMAFMNNPYILDDPKAYRRIEELFGEGRWEREVVPALRRIHPDMALFFDRLLDDPSQGIKAVVQGLPHFSHSYQMWLKLLKQKVGPKLRELAQAS
jgi:DNA-directed RNA polymerase specialized sigma24 family protein